MAKTKHLIGFCFIGRTHRGRPSKYFTETTGSTATLFFPFSPFSRPFSRLSVYACARGTHAYRRWAGADSIFQKNSMSPVPFSPLLPCAEGADTIARVLATRLMIMNPLTLKLASSCNDFSRIRHRNPRSAGIDLRFGLRIDKSISNVVCCLFSYCETKTLGMGDSGCSSVNDQISR